MTPTTSPVIDPVIDPALGAPLLGDLGFLLTPDEIGSDMPAYLLVALRSSPTLRHFDPEMVEYWVDRNGRGAVEAFTRATPLPLDDLFSWGRIRIVDRLEAANEYLTFGGRLMAARLDGFAAAVFSSPVPMVRAGGHSQDRDPNAIAIAAFFARLRAAAGQGRDVERQISSVPPDARYAAYLLEAAAKYAASSTLRSMYPRASLSLERQERRLRAERATAFTQGRGLLRLLAQVSGSTHEMEASDVRA